MRNGGNLVTSNLFIFESLYVLYSFSLVPLNLARILNNGTWGIMFSVNSSLNNGGGGKSRVKYKKVVSSTFSEKDQ